MKILYDHQAFTGLSYGGVSRYFYELMQSFAQRTDITFELSLALSNNDYLDQSDFSRPIRFRTLAHMRRANQVASVLNQLHSRRRLRANRFDIFHPTYYHRYFLNELSQKPLVLTFHDATSERYGRLYPDVGAGLTDLKKVLLQRADRIIAVSEFSREEILRYFPVDPAKISVVHLGTSFSEYVPTQPIQPLPFPYLLYVGKRGLYKNFDGFFRAIQPLLNRYPDLHLVCAGGGLFSTAEHTLFHAAHLNERIHYHPINDDSLYSLYQHARAFVFPSLNEGFGIPVLEAFSAGCPVVLSDRSSLPEVAGEAAVYFDPENPEAIADAVEQVVISDHLRSDLSQKGTSRLTHFSCEKTARQTFDVYKQLS